MFVISEDVEISIQKKYPTVHARGLIDTIFREILDKTIRDGSCKVETFGKFVCYVSHSEKLDANVVRFKFRPSITLTKKLRSDQFLLNNLPKMKVKEKEDFTGENIDEKNIETKKKNLQNRVLSEKEGDVRTKETLAMMEIERIMEQIESD